MFDSFSLAISAICWRRAAWVWSQAKTASFLVEPVAVELAPAAARGSMAIDEFSGAVG